MKFWEDLWQNTKRAFSTSCPKCKKNDADLPSEKRIHRFVVKKHPHYHHHYHQGHDGKLHHQMTIDWEKTVELSCQNCGHTWTIKETEYGWRNR
ncbi:MAG TPA: hypothetical protein IGS52_03830 [Oscillatoriaceae cyanobacterium M33_DOE_052]|nr:hypothetical protein [Oscillatoriaceae cyanobacterium M33_DOE_052]